MQQAGASARARLVQAAADEWNVPATECEAHQGKVIHKPAARSLTFGDAGQGCRQGDACRRTRDKESGSIQAWRARASHDSDSAIKSNGTARFGIDTREPGQLYASIMSCPVFGGKLVSVDDSAIKGRRGIVKVVKLDDAVAVVADNYWRANEALKALKITWDGGSNAARRQRAIPRRLSEALDGPMVPARNDGDAKSAIAGSKSVVEAVYETPLLAHATMEPCNATVHLRDGKLDVWMGSQSALANARMAAQLAGVDPSQVYFHQPYLGGGFGRSVPSGMNCATPFWWRRRVTLTCRCSWSGRGNRTCMPTVIGHNRQFGSREHLPPTAGWTALHIESACGSIQKSTGQMHGDAVDNTSVEGIGPSVPYNKVPNWYTGIQNKNTHVPVAYWRSVGGSQNCFYLESFIDELAHAAGKDPLDFRRSLTDRADSLSVLNKLEEVSGWHTPLPPGRGRGISLVDNHGAIGGHVAEVTVGGKGTVSVDRVFAATDAYHVVNPNLVEAQIEGGVIFGMTAMLYGEVTIKNGAAVESNFNKYRMVTLSEAPDVKAYLANTGGVDQRGKPKWGGVGECSVAPIAAAIANAIFAASGKRIRSLPFKNVKWTELSRL